MRTFGCQEAAGRAAWTRQAVSLIAGVGAVAALTIGSNPAMASGADPKPIGGGVQAQNNGPMVHYYPLLPAQQGMEFSSITDFNGILGAAHVENMGTLVDKATGQTFRYPFKTDIRFMQGYYVGSDGNSYAGTFALIFLRIQEYHGGPDIHAVSIGVAPSGLVSTMAMTPTGLTIDNNTGKVDMKLRNTPMRDYQSLDAALANGPNQAATIVYLNAHWKTPISSYSFSDNQQFFRGTYTNIHAIAEFKIDTPSYTYTTDVDSTSHEDVAVVAREWNGLFW